MAKTTKKTVTKKIVITKEQKLITKLLRLSKGTKVYFCSLDRNTILVNVDNNPDGCFEFWVIHKGKKICGINTEDFITFRKLKQTKFVI